MTLRRLLTFCITFFVLIAPVASNANVLDGVFSPVTQEHSDSPQTTMADCHGVQDDMHQSDAKVAHSCCLSFVGIIPDTYLVPTPQGVGGLIPFNPSMSLALRIDGLYRPPRQNS